MKQVICSTFGLRSILVMLMVAVSSNVFGAENALGFQFDAQAQQVLVADSASLDITGPFTLEAWVKPDAGFSDEGINFIIAKHFGGTGFALLALGTGVNKRFVFEANKVGDSNNGAVGITQPVAGKWTHVAGVWGNGSARLYVNGELEGEVAVLAPPVANDLALQIGASIFGRNFNWQGLLDEVRIWNVARTPAELQGSMFATLGGNEPGMVGYWRCDEGTGTSTADLTNNGNNATLTNVSWQTSNWFPFLHEDGFETVGLKRWSQGDWER